VAALVEVGGCRGSGSAVGVAADPATRPLERLCELARGRPSGFQANAPRPGSGRRRIRQRDESGDIKVRFVDDDGAIVANDSR